MTGWKRKAAALAIASFLLTTLMGGCASPTPNPGPTSVVPTTAPGATLAPVLASLPDAPDRDLYALTRRLVLKNDAPIPRTVESSPKLFSVGDRQDFWVLDVIDRKALRIVGVLRHISQRAYWYVDPALSISTGDLERAAAAFDERIYPTVARYFGEPWSPGVDNDPRITILHTALRGAAGYYTSTDQYPQVVSRYSNQREMIYVNPQGRALGSDAYLGLLAHELQHAAHWASDSGEETWLNEGMSELAEALLGFPSTSESLFLANPAVSLVNWPPSPGASIAYYGAAYRFLTYLMEHYGGPEQIPRLVSLPQDGIAAVDTFLVELGFKERFEDIFGRWVVANYLGNVEGPYGYKSPQRPVAATRRIREPGVAEGSVAQFAAQYLELDLPPGDYRLLFRGQPYTSLLPTAPHSGSSCWWSNGGDSIDSTLTRPLDLRGVDTATLTFWAWYNIEEWWDYAYVEVSTDGGRGWDILAGPGARPENPVGTGFGAGYTGPSNGWVQEAIDLTPYAGREVLLRFEYVTDDSTHLDGICVDDVAVPEIGLFDDAEADGPWTPQGFIRTDNRVPQGYIVQVIELGKEPRVRRLALDAQNQGELVLEGMGAAFRQAVVVAALAPKTRLPAPYSLTVDKAR